MSTSISFPRDTMEQAKLAAQGWRELEDKLVVPSLNLTEFLAKVSNAQQCIDQAEEYRIKRSKAIEERIRVLKDVWDCTKRIRNAAKATFGDASPEVEKMGVIPVTSRGRRSL